MSTINNSLINDVKSKLLKFTKPQLVIAFTSVSIFMPFIITCVAIIVAVTWAILNKDIRKKMFSDKKDIPIYIFSGLALIVPLLYGRYISALVGIGVVIVLLFLLFVKAIMDKLFFNKVMDICCASSIICFVYALIQKIILGVSFRTTGGLLNANYYGSICELVIIIAAYRIITNSKYNKFYIPIIAINVAGIILCDCQSAWIAVMIGVIGLLFFSNHKKQCLIFLTVSVVLVVAGIFVPGLLPRMDVMPQTFSTRLNIWTTAIKGIKAHWLFGQGTLTYLFMCDSYGGYKTYHAHSLYLDPFLSYGLVGVSILISYIVSVIKRIRANFKLRLNCDIMAVVLAVAFAVCVHGITDITLLWVQTGMLFFIIVSGAFIKSQKSS